MEKKVLVTIPSLPPFEEYVEEIRGIWENHYLTNFGPLEEKLAEELRKYLGVKHLTLFVNGHQALTAALSCLDLKGEVITTPFTFASTTHAIVSNGLTPVFADVDPITYTITPDACEKLINENTGAILPVHVYGTLCDVSGFDELSKKYNIPVIYDAAHCFGVKKSGLGAGNFGKCSMFSFHATKAYNSIEGGAIATDDEELARKLKRFENFGLKGEDADFGSNAKMNEFSAAMGLCNLRHIGEILEKRKKIVDCYLDVFGKADPFYDKKTGIFPTLHIKFLPIQDDVLRNYAYFPIVFDKEAGCKVSCTDVMEKLERINVMTRRYFYPLTSDFTCYKNKFGNKLPVAEKISSSVLSMPIYGDLEISYVEEIANKVVEMLL